MCSNLKDRVIKEFCSTAPRWREVCSGLSLEGTCKNRSCDAYNRRAVAKIGFGYKNLNLEANTAECPICPKVMKDVNCITFSNCRYAVNGLKIVYGKRVRVNDGY